MKIAFVSQPIDVVLPPFQNSVGACTYGAACALAQSHDVTVFGLEQRNQTTPEVRTRNVTFRFLAPNAADQKLSSLRNKVSKLVQLAAPVSTSRWSYPNYGRQLAETLAKEQFDIIHIQHTSQYVPVIRRLNPKAKIVLHLHAEWFSQSRPERLAGRLKGLNLLTGVSDHITQKTRQQLPAFAERCHTVYNGIDEQEFSAERDYTASSDQRTPRIMYAGGVSPHKGIHVLLDAFKIVAERVPDVRLEIIGPHGTYPLEETFDLQDRGLLRDLAPFYTSKLASTIKRKLFGKNARSEQYVEYLKSKMSGAVAARTEFLGMIPRPELVQRYYAADVFVFPPIWDEGFGIPPIEAMVAGAAVVASRSGAVVETVQHGKTGVLVPKNDPESLADAICMLLRDQTMRERMGRAGRRRVLENFTWSAVAGNMDRIYRSLVKGPASQTSGTHLENSWTQSLNSASMARRSARLRDRALDH